MMTSFTFVYSYY